jgi:hypothetical protein
VLLTITFKSDDFLFCNTIISVNALMPDDVYPALRDAGFSSLKSLHMRQSITANLMQPLWGICLLFLFFKSLHK